MSGIIGNLSCSNARDTQCRNQPIAQDGALTGEIVQNSDNAILPRNNCIASSCNSGDEFVSSRIQGSNQDTQVSKKDVIALLKMVLQMNSKIVDLLGHLIKEKPEQTAENEEQEVDPGQNTDPSQKTDPSQETDLSSGPESKETEAESNGKHIDKVESPENKKGFNPQVGTAEVVNIFNLQIAA